MFLGLLLFPPLLPNTGRDNYHCMCLPFVEEGETSENLRQSIHKQVLCRDLFPRRDVFPVVPAPVRNYPNGEGSARTQKARPRAAVLVPQRHFGES